MVIYLDLIFITGSIDVFDTITSSLQKNLRTNDAINGNIIGANYYGYSINSILILEVCMLAILESDADGDGVGDSGFVIGGFL
jgi:hypothetical protein